jgi:uncharacterized membrane protein YebE (DUF533 family)
MRKLASGALGYGGGAALGALAHRAYQNYVEGRSVHSTPTVTPGEIAQLPVTQLAHEERAPNGFELVLIEAMVAAAKADGHIDAGEQRRLFAEVEHLSLDAESKAHVLDLLRRPVDPSRIEVAARDPEQAAQV